MLQILYSMLRAVLPPVGVLSDLIDQWYLIWIGKEGEVFYAAKEEDSYGKVKILTRLTALYHVLIYLKNFQKTQSRKF